MSFSKIAILGPGLLGGSLAMALRAKGVTTPVSLWARRETAVQAVRALGVRADATTDLAEAVRDAELVVLCTPVETMGDLARTFRPHLLPGAIVTDVGSVKESVVRALEAALADQARVVGSHPMAGSERTGIAHARPDLFEGAACIVTPDTGTDRAATDGVGAFWTALGARVHRMSPVEHDRIVALISHLPHVAAAALVNLVCAGAPDGLNVCGNGFLDTTRVASGSPELWAEILVANRLEVLAALDGMSRVLIDFRMALAAGSTDKLEKLLEEAKRFRDAANATRDHVTDQS